MSGEGGGGGDGSGDGGKGGGGCLWVWLLLLLLVVCHACEVYARVRSGAGINRAVRVEDPCAIAMASMARG